MQIQKYFCINTVTFFGKYSGIFGANTVIFWTNTVFGQKKSGTWGKKQWYLRAKTAVFGDNTDFFFLYKYSYIFSIYSGIWGETQWCLSQIQWVFAQIKRCMGQIQ